MTQVLRSEATKDPLPEMGGGSFAALRICGFMVMLVFAQAAMACPVCYGDPNSAMTKGTNYGVLFLLGVVGFVQVGFVALFFAFWRRGQALRRRRESLRLLEGGVR